jgi:hypothetical protein
VRVLACVLALGLLFVPAATATPSGLKLLARDGNRLGLVYLDRATPFTQPLRAGPYQPLAFSGDGRLVSIGGTIVGRAKLPTRTLAWSPAGERAAYVTTEGAVVEWTPAGKRFVEPKGWGANWGVAWSRDGALAVSRGSEIWVIRHGSARRVVGPIPANCCTGGPDIPVPFAWAGSHVLWWDYPASGSVASDGVALWEDTAKLGTTLMDRDFVALCGSHVAFVQGGDRDTNNGKSIVFDGRDVTHDATRSWVTPTCNANGVLVAAAGSDLGVCCHIHTEHRSLWQLLPTRRRVTHAPPGWTDESPHLFANGDVLFVRTRMTSVRSGATWRDTERGHVMLLSHGTLRQMADIGFVENEDKQYLGPFYDHYDFSPLLAVWP